MSLSELQRLFVKLVGLLIDHAYSQGYELTFAEAFRTPEQAQWDFEHHTGIVNSLHCVRLAIDLNLFVDGVYQTDGAAYAPLGAFWKTLHPSAAGGATSSGWTPTTSR
jgi:hypothetical protein